MKKYMIFGCIAVLLICFAGCAGTPVEETPELPPVQVSAYLTAQEVRTAVGFSVDEPLEMADGSVAYSSLNDTSIVYFSSQKMSRTEYDSLIQTIKDAGGVSTGAPNLGEAAFWFENDVNLFVYASGYAMDIRVEYATARPNDSLLAARQLAAVFIEKL